jgi:hypothetical protein
MSTLSKSVIGCDAVITSDYLKSVTNVRLSRGTFL